MAKDKGGQEHVAPTTNNEVTDAAVAEEQDQGSADAQERKSALDEDVDSILDEIDQVLEENAEEFVRGFVQKGGE